VPALVLTKKFKKGLNKKPQTMAAAIARCVYRLGEDPAHPGLNTHKIRGKEGVWEAYVDDANRVTFHYDQDGAIVLRNHCNHDIIKRSP